MGKGRKTQHQGTQRSDTAGKFIPRMERTFKLVSKIQEDISIYPLHPHLDTSVATNKSKSKEFGEVFTPLWLVDEMLELPTISSHTTTLDLCAGYGQFSIRLMRKLHQQESDFDLNNFIKNTHSFSELQLSSCHKLLLTFGVNINLYIGDFMRLPKLPEVASGIWCYLEEMGRWVPLTATIKKILKEDKPTEAAFVKRLQHLIDRLNKGYAEVKEATLNIRYSTSTRLYALKLLDDALNDMVEDQTVRTPQEIVNDLLEPISDLDAKQILVLFNGEIVEALVHAKKVKRENITFGIEEARKARGEFVNKMWGVEVVEFAEKTPKSIMEALGQKKWDVVLSNPPYNRGLDLKILQAMLDAEVAKEYVVVHPSTWLLDQKDKKPQYLTFKKTLEKKLRSVKLFNGNAVFNLEKGGLFVPCTITHIDTDYSNDTVSVELFKDKFTVNIISDITKFGSQWTTVVQPFFKKIEREIRIHNHIWSHNETVVDPTKVYAQLAAIIGNHSKDKSVLVKDDFYTMTIRNSSDNKGIRESRLDKPGGHTPTFGFQTEVERDNFLSYLNTDFARFCLALYKIGQHLENGELEIIPWLDFTQTWDDDKLFSHFDIDQPTQDYIRSFLPDYYGIREKMSFVDAAIEVLRRNNNNPLSPKEIWERIAEAGLAKSDGKTPENTLATMLGARVQNTNFSTKTLTTQNPRGERQFVKEGGKFKLIDTIYAAPPILVEVDTEMPAFTFKFMG